MRTIRNLFAVMLTGLAFAAFQSDACAQTRSGESRSARTSRSTGSSNVNRSATRPSSQNRSAVTTRQVKPSVSQDNTRPRSGSVADRKPSTTVRRPDDRMEVNRPGRVVGTPRNHRSSSAAVKRSAPESVRKSPSSSVRRPSETVSKRNSPGSSYRPERNRKQPAPILHNHMHKGPRVHPAHRDFIRYDRPSCFWTGHNHYFGHRVRVLPSRAVMHTHFGISYYCYNNIWYRPYSGYYVVCRPPFGTVLAANLIADMVWTAVRFSYYNTVSNTYRQINENNRYIAEQNAIIAQNNATIAAQNNTIAMNQNLAVTAGTLADELGLVQSYAAANGEYFYQDGIFYTKAANGEYTVIVPPAGALVETLPEDYEMVNLGGNDYYKVDDTVFKVTLSDGKPYFEVMGQLT